MWFALHGGSGGGKDAWSAGLLLCVMNDEVRCDESFELEDFVDLKLAVCGEVLFVLIPLLV